MTSPSDLDRPDDDQTQRSQAGFSATGDTVPRMRSAGQTIIVPFEDMSDDGPEPIRVAQLDPVPSPAADEPTVMQLEVPVKADKRLPMLGPVFDLVASVPRWAWIAAAALFFVFGSLGFVLVAVAVAAYVYLS